MNTEIFHKFLNRIPPNLPKEETIKKRIQIADSIHFMECFDEDLKLIECVEYPLNIIQSNEKRYGVLFYEIDAFNEKEVTPKLYKELTSDFYKKQIKIDEIWFVFVEDWKRNNSKDYMNYSNFYDLPLEYDRIYLFKFKTGEIRLLNR